MFTWPSPVPREASLSTFGGFRAPPGAALLLPPQPASRSRPAAEAAVRTRDRRIVDTPCREVGRRCATRSAGRRSPAVRIGCGGYRDDVLGPPGEPDPAVPQCRDVGRRGV